MYVYSANWLIKEIQEWDAVCLKLHEVLPRAEADRKIKQIQNDCGGDFEFAIYWINQACKIATESE